MIGTKILNYTIKDTIGKGGMATVYEAQHNSLTNRKAAIKVLDPILVANESIRSRFMQEAQIMADLEHPNIVHVLDFYKDERILAIIMERLEGQTLSDYIEQKGKLDVSTCQKLLLPVCQAFQYAHNKHIVHRDAKASNIYITKDGTPKILDFGIAKLLDSDAQQTSTGAQMGTPVYMSPEQVKSAKDIDHRSDIYSLGVLLYYMLNGKPPYDSTTLSNFDILTKIVNDPLPDLPQQPQMNVIISKATAKERADRFQSCNELAQALKNLTTQQADNNKTLVDEPAPSITSANKKDDDKTQVDDPIEQQDYEPIIHEEPLVEDKQQAPIHDVPEPKKKKKRWLVPVITVFFLALLAAGYFLFWPTDEKAWKKAEAEDSIEAYEAYLDEYPRGEYRRDAKKAITKLEEEADEQAWKDVQEENTISAYKQYIEDYPDGQFFIHAEYKVDEMTLIQDIENQMIRIDGGAFMMGADNDFSHTSEKPIHRVVVDDFYIGKYELTFAIYDRYCNLKEDYYAIYFDSDTIGMEKPDDEGWGRDKRPVINLSYYEAVAFCEWLSERTGDKYRLPTEAEWEYACRAGTASHFNTGKCLSTDDANYNGNSPLDACTKGLFRNNTIPVGNFSANNYGLYDMHGNVWELCSDYYASDYYDYSPANNPKGPDYGENKVARGGSYNTAAFSCRSSYRAYASEDLKHDELGFRIVREP